MNIEATSLNLTAPVPLWVRRVVLGIFVASCLAGVASGLERLTQLRRLAAIAYHPYLAHAGLPDNFYVVYFLGLESILAIAFALTGGLIALQRSATWVTIFTAVTLLLFGVTLPPLLHATVVIQHDFSLPLRCLHAIGLALFIIFFYIFPDGRFVPRWTGYLTVVLIVWSLLWPFYPPANPYKWSHGIPFLVLLFWFSTGVFAQIYRYIRVSSSIERQQTKWVVYGLTIAVLGDFVTHSPWTIFHLQTGPDWLFSLAHHPLFVLSQLMVPLSIGFSIFRYGLWEIDFIINRTLVYGLLMALLAAAWKLSTKLLENLFKLMLGSNTGPITAGLSVLLVGIVGWPVREYLEVLVDRYFSPHTIHLSKNFSEFLPEAYANVDLSDILRVFLDRLMELLEIKHGAVWLCDVSIQLRDIDSQLQLACDRNLSDRNLIPKTVNSLTWDNNLLEELRQGKVIDRQEDKTFSLLIPLMLKRKQKPELIGVLAFGPRADGRGYSHDEMGTFNKLGSQAGTAIYIAQLNRENQMARNKQLANLENRLETLDAKLTKLMKLNKNLGN